MSKFPIGSYVRVINKNLESYGLIGQVINPEEYYLDCSDTCVYICFEHWHNEREKILKIKKKNIEKVEDGGNNMASKMLVGNYAVAMCILDSDCNKKKYAFAAFPEDDIREGDRVLVDTAHGQTIAKVDSMMAQMDYNGVDVTKEVICKLDYSNFEKRKESRKRLGNLKNQMDNIVAQNQNMILYTAIAKENPKMAALLNQYKKIAGIN